MAMNNGLQRIWKEMAIAVCMVLFWHLPGRNERSQKNTSVSILYVPAKIQISTL
jgi:hypothetical protein